MFALISCITPDLCVRHRRCVFKRIIKSSVCVDSDPADPNTCELSALTPGLLLKERARLGRTPVNFNRPHKETFQPGVELLGGLKRPRRSALAARSSRSARPPSPDIPSEAGEVALVRAVWLSEKSSRSKVKAGSFRLPERGLTVFSVLNPVRAPSDCDI